MLAASLSCRQLPRMLATPRPVALAVRPVAAVSLPCLLLAACPPHTPRPSLLAATRQQAGETVQHYKQRMDEKAAAAAKRAAVDEEILVAGFQHTQNVCRTSDGVRRFVAAQVHDLVAG